jgi:hypothetical protein
MTQSCRRHSLWCPVGCLFLTSLPFILALPAQSATLRVGGEALLKAPSDAAAVAQDGDTIIIAPGTYFDCAIWHANNLSIEGAGPGVVLTDKPCEGKASFVIRGDSATVRNLTFTRIRVPDRNGAGIRAEGHGLTVENSRFIDNQVGILAGGAMPSTIIIRDCDFAQNGLADTDGSTADLLIGRIARLRMEGSRLQDNKGSAAITSDALSTELSGNRLESSGSGGQRYIVGAFGGGSLVMDDNTITLAATGVTRIAAVAVAQDSELPAGQVTLRHTALINDTGQPAILLRNWGAVTPVMTDNALQPGDIELSTSGATLHAIKQAMHRTGAWLHAIAADLRHMVAIVVRGLYQAAGV